MKHVAFEYHAADVIRAASSAVNSLSIKGGRTDNACSRAADWTFHMFGPEECPSPKGALQQTDYLPVSLGPHFADLQSRLTFQLF